MTAADIRRLLDDAAAGELPGEEELDALGLSRKDRLQVSDAATLAVAANAAGQVVQARRIAREAADRIVNGSATALNPGYELGEAA